LNTVAAQPSQLKLHHVDACLDAHKCSWLQRPRNNRMVI
jgi:hypothetical protein